MKELPFLLDKQLLLRQALIGWLILLSAVLVFATISTSLMILGFGKELSILTSLVIVGSGLAAVHLFFSVNNYRIHEIEQSGLYPIVNEILLKNSIKHLSSLKNRASLLKNEIISKEVEYQNITTKYITIMKEEYKLSYEKERLDRKASNLEININEIKRGIARVENTIENLQNSSRKIKKLLNEIRARNEILEEIRARLEKGIAVTLPLQKHRYQVPYVRMEHYKLLDIEPSIFREMPLVKLPTYASSWGMRSMEDAGEYVAKVKETDFAFFVKAYVEIAENFNVTLTKYLSDLEQRIKDSDQIIRKTELDNKALNKAIKSLLTQIDHLEQKFSTLQATLSLSIEKHNKIAVDHESLIKNYNKAHDYHLGLLETISKLRTAFESDKGPEFPSN